MRKNIKEIVGIVVPGHGPNEGFAKKFFQVVPVEEKAAEIVVDKGALNASGMHVMVRGLW